MEAQTKDGCTPLFLAFVNGNLEVIKTLIENKASLEALTNTKQTVLHAAVQSAPLECIEFLLDKNCAVDAQDSKGWTPLHIAARYDVLPAVKVLIERGADMDAQTKDGCTPFHLAAIQGGYECARILLKKGALIDTQAYDGNTVLSLAAKLKKNIAGVSECVKLLLDAGANPYHVAKERTMLLESVIASGHKVILDAFVSRCYKFFLPSDHDVNVSCRRIATSLVGFYYASGKNLFFVKDKNLIAMLLQANERTWRDVVNIFLGAVKRGKVEDNAVLMFARKSAVDYFIERIKPICSSIRQLNDVNQARKDLIDPGKLKEHFEDIIRQGLDEYCDKLQPIVSNKNDEEMVDLSHNSNEVVDEKAGDNRKEPA